VRKLLIVLFSLLFVTALAACGDDGDDESGSASAVEEDEEAEDDEAEDDEADEDEAEEDEGESGGGDAEASDEFCARADELANDESLDELDITNPEDAAIATGLLSGLADIAPDEIRDDIRLLADAYPELAAAIAEAAVDPTASEEAFAELEAEFAEATAAGERMEQFILDACGVDFSGE
jgi:hypothetical protein